MWTLHHHNRYPPPAAGDIFPRELRAELGQYDRRYAGRCASFPAIRPTRSCSLHRTSPLLSRSTDGGRPAAHLPIPRTCSRQNEDYRFHVDANEPGPSALQAGGPLVVPSQRRCRGRGPPIGPTLIRRWPARTRPSSPDTAAGRRLGAELSAGCCTDGSGPLRRADQLPFPVGLDQLGAGATRRESTGPTSAPIHDLVAGRLASAATCWCCRWATRSCT